MVRTMDLGASPLTSFIFHYCCRATAAVVVVKLAPTPPNYVSRSHDTYFKLHLHDKVSSFINQLLQLVAVHKDIKPVLKASTIVVKTRRAS